GANIGCVVDRQQAGKGLSTNIGFYILVETPSLPLPPPAEAIVTPQGLVTVEHPKANTSGVAFAGCPFKRNSFSILLPHQPEMLVSATIHAKVIPAAEISTASAPPTASGSAQSSPPVASQGSLTAHQVETTLHSAVPGACGRAVEVSCDDLG